MKKYNKNENKKKKRFERKIEKKRFSKISH